MIQDFPRLKISEDVSHVTQEKSGATNILLVANAKILTITILLVSTSPQTPQKHVAKEDQSQSLVNERCCSIVEVSSSCPLALLFLWNLSSATPKFLRSLQN